MSDAICETCGGVYDKESVTFCSSSFHCCRDCEWLNGVAVKVCKFCHDRAVRVAVDWDRSQTSTIPDRIARAGSALDEIQRLDRLVDRKDEQMAELQEYIESLLSAQKAQAEAFIQVGEVGRKQLAAATTRADEAEKKISELNEYIEELAKHCAVDQDVNLDSHKEGK